MGLERLDHPCQLLGIKVHVILGTRGFLDVLENLLELSLGHAHDDVAEHHDEAPVAVQGEGPPAAQHSETFGGTVVQAEVEDRVHHARHGEL